MAAAAAAASTIYALRDQLHTKSLKLEGTNILVAVIVHGGEEKTSRLDLNTVLQNINGTFKWGVGDFSKTAKNVVLEGSILRALLQNSAKDKDLPAQVDLAEYIFNADGKLKFFQNGATITPPHAAPRQPPTQVQPPFTQRGFLTDPAKDGNVEARAFTVASDVTQDRAVIAYKTQVDDTVSLAEVSFNKGVWGAATEIDVYQQYVPGHRFAITYDPIEPDQRHLFFSEEDGDGYVYIQSYDPKVGKWRVPEKLRGLDGKEGQVKAHRFSGFAATFISGNSPDNVILLYFIDESSALLEYVGKRYFDGYRFYRTETLEQDLILKGSISAVHKKGKTYVTYRNPQKDLALAVGTNRVKMPDAPATPTSRIVRASKAGQADWETHIIRSKTQLVKNSPLSIAIQESGPVVFYLQRFKKTESIYAIDINIASTIPFVDLPARGVSKLEPGSNIAAASLAITSYNKHHVRLYSVSKLDGDNILLERIQKSSKEWALSGGVVDTDVDHIVNVRSEPDE